MSPETITEKPGDYRLGSIQSRIAARAILERIRVEQEKNAIIVMVEHIGHDGRDPLPPPRRILSPAGVTGIIHVAERSL
jgi:hypothetical protein